MCVFGRIFHGATDWSHGGPIGALLERAASHLPHLPHLHPETRPADDPRRRVAFTIAVIALGAKMARADGEVTRDEVAAFNEVFQVPPGEEAHMRTIFDLARRSTHGFESYARQIGRLFAGNKLVLEDLLGGLFHIALADGAVCAAEDQYLRDVAHHFGFTPQEYARITPVSMPARRTRRTTTRTTSSGWCAARRRTRSAAPTTGWCAKTTPTS